MRRTILTIIAAGPLLLSTAGVTAQKKIEAVGSALSPSAVYDDGRNTVSGSSLWEQQVIWGE